MVRVRVYQQYQLEPQFRHCNSPLVRSQSKVIHSMSSCPPVSPSSARAHSFRVDFEPPVTQALQLVVRGDAGVTLYLALIGKWHQCPIALAQPLRWSVADVEGAGVSATAQLDAQPTEPGSEKGDTLSDVNPAARFAPRVDVLADT